MGGNVSKNTVELLKKDIIDASIKYLQETVSKTSINVALSANQAIIIDRTDIKCKKNAYFQNQLTAETQVFNTMTNVEQANFTTFLESTMTASIINSVEQANKDLNLFQVNVDIKDTKVYQELILDLSTTISNKTQQLFNGDLTQLLSQEIVITNSEIVCGGDVFVINSIALDNVMINVMEDTNVAEILNKISTGLDADVKNFSSQLNDGLGLLDLFLLPIIIIACIALVSLGGLSFLKNRLGAFPKLFTQTRTEGRGKRSAKVAPVETISLRLV